MNNKRTFSEIAQEVMSAWDKRYGANIPASFYGALPYLRAMRLCHTSDKHALYLHDSLENIVLRFLCNAGAWRGEQAQAIKQELKNMLKDE